MDGQDWTTVTLKRNRTKKETIQRGNYTTQTRDPLQNERIRLSKLETSDTPLPKKRIIPLSLQELIRKRIEMKLSQDKADVLCSFPKHTFKAIEANQLIPSEEQKRRIQQQLTIQLKIEIV